MRRIGIQRPSRKGRFTRSLLGVAFAAATWSVFTAASASGHADALPTFTSSPSAAQIVQGQSVTDVATAVGDSTLGLPAAPIVIQNVNEIDGSTVVGASGGFPGVRTNDNVTGDGVPAGTIVAAISPGTGTATLRAGSASLGPEPGRSSSLASAEPRSGVAGPLTACPDSLIGERRNEEQ